MGAVVIKTQVTKNADTFLVHLQGAGTKGLLIRWERGRTWGCLEARGTDMIDHSELEAFCNAYLAARAEERQDEAIAKCATS